MSLIYLTRMAILVLAIAVKYKYKSGARRRARKNRRLVQPNAMIWRSRTIRARV
ncbi:hypothetical protein EXIGLDRAFT_721984 [Exidia glandulosa HHB12029]|uniref:Uncharacterized protein n=1 Tax=Exidia glandulosa HHB12029 TaxID=1314781 RepID=A0A165FJS7_EXIGL|nr:hypothetical protein EXIGLDRAFT_721984 [Exidia glandulosa HHB12029]